MQKILGIDMGTKRIGVALSNFEQTFAFPYGVIEGKRDQVDIEGEVLSEIIDILKKEKVKIIVIGESKDFAQQYNPIMKQVHILKSALEHKGFRVVLEPEFLTSAQAERFQGKHNKIDASAATIILQSYLDRMVAAK